MNRLVVLVGLPGSGKSAFQRRHPEWAVVSKDAIRREIFHCNFAPEHEPVIDRVFAATLVEVVDSSAEVVCVDDLNLRRDTRRELIELAQLAGREPVAYVMADHPVDVLYERAVENAEGLSKSDPAFRVSDLSRARFAELARSYESVDVREGFARVERVHVERVDVERDMPRRAPSRAQRRRSRIEKRQPLPLFVP